MKRRNCKNYIIPIVLTIFVLTFASTLEAVTISSINSNAINYITSNANISINTYNQTWLDFPGVINGAVILGSTSQFNYLINGTKPFAISFWLKKNNTQNGNIISDKIGVSGFDFVINTVFSMRIYNSTGSLVAHNCAADCLTYITDNKWHNYIISSNGTYLNLFVDSNNYTLTDADKGISAQNSNTTVYLGAGGSFYMNGSFDDVRLYNRSLYPGEEGLIYNSGREGINNEFTIVMIPDSQKMVAEGGGYFDNQTKWIYENRNLRNIVFVTHIGDIVDDGSNLTQWQTAYNSMNYLKDMPYVISYGNHDPQNNLVWDKNITNMERYFNISDFNTKTWWGGNMSSDYANTYQLFSGGGINFLHLSLEFCPSNASLNWATSIVNKYPDRKVIVSTHSYLNTAGYSNGDGTYSAYRLNETTNGCRNPAVYNFSDGNQGEDQWQGWYKYWPNLMIVLSGHWYSGTGSWHRTDTGVNGNIVYQLHLDDQAYTQGGLRIIDFYTYNNTIKSYKLVPYNASYSPQHAGYNYTLDYGFSPSFDKYGTLAFWKFNENNGSIIHDVSGNNVDASAQALTSWNNDGIVITTLLKYFWVGQNLVTSNNLIISPVSWLYQYLISNSTNVPNDYVLLNNTNQNSNYILDLGSLTNALLYFSDGSAQTCNGNCNITLKPNEYVYVFDNFDRLNSHSYLVGILGQSAVNSIYSQIGWREVTNMGVCTNSSSILLGFIVLIPLIIILAIFFLVLGFKNGSFREISIESLLPVVGSILFLILLIGIGSIIVFSIGGC